MQKKTTQVKRKYDGGGEKKQLAHARTTLERSQTPSEGGWCFTAEQTRFQGLYNDLRKHTQFSPQYMKCVYWQELLIYAGWLDFIGYCVMGVNALLLIFVSSPGLNYYVLSSDPAEE